MNPSAKVWLSAEVSPTGLVTIADRDGRPLFVGGTAQCSPELLNVLDAAYAADVRRLEALLGSLRDESHAPHPHLEATEVPERPPGPVPVEGLFQAPLPQVCRPRTYLSFDGPGLGLPGLSLLDVPPEVVL